MNVTLLLNHAVSFKCKNEEVSGGVQVPKTVKKKQYATKCLEQCPEA